ncbi:hypothetical protein VL20_2320 [Microcystis panniformis FACHB-1757]|uniref:Uncharacterized protein n=1 Tax=Microcystis panniformis FACHB-1757 TaxID=1638788 RepID=A0A0K1S081_9CHRO|nr:hypothetical protein VL20_2320 [Microcystis panniformis FACHB-1757]
MPTIHALIDNLIAAPLIKGGLRGDQGGIKGGLRGIKGGSKPPQG